MAKTIEYVRRHNPLGEFIRIEAAARGFQQRDEYGKPRLTTLLGAKCGRTNQWASNIMHGRSRPHDGTLRLLTEALREGEPPEVKEAFFERLKALRERQFPVVHKAFKLTDLDDHWLGTLSCRWSMQKAVYVYGHKVEDGRYKIALKRAIGKNSEAEPWILFFTNYKQRNKVQWSKQAPWKGVRGTIGVFYLKSDLIRGKDIVLKRGGVFNIGGRLSANGSVYCSRLLETIEAVKKQPVDVPAFSEPTGNGVQQPTDPVNKDSPVNLNTALTRREYDSLPADGQMQCPDCGTTEVRLTVGDGNCRCKGAHINLWHHVCPDRWVDTFEDFKAVAAVAGFTDDDYLRGLWDNSPRHWRLPWDVAKMGFLKQAEVLGFTPNLDADRPQNK